MNLFDILGPVMVGPSSSHTAGAVRIGYISEKLLQDHVRKAEILLHGSFATTGIGHGTDKALVAGLLGMRPDDIRIPTSFELAKKNGMEFSFSTVTLKDAHPNTAVLRLTGQHGRKIEVQAASIGGGRILIAKLDGMLKLVDFITERSPQIIAEYRQRLEERVKELLGDTTVDEGRLLTEVTIFADKVCVDEELVRLRSHIETTKNTLTAGGSIGRKLDFLAQEMNREANTILSKSNDLEISNCAIELKTEIEKVREQIQNIE
jgi:iron-sulfur-dependent L-serine dehydratase beta subunit